MGFCLCLMYMSACPTSQNYTYNNRNNIYKNNNTYNNSNNNNNNNKKKKKENLATDKYELTFLGDPNMPETSANL